MVVRYVLKYMAAQKNDKDWIVQKRLLSARRASQMAVFDNEIERWGEVDVPYLPVAVILYLINAAPLPESSLQHTAPHFSGILGSRSVADDSKKNRQDARSCEDRRKLSWLCSSSRRDCFRPVFFQTEESVKISPPKVGVRGLFSADLRIQRRSSIRKTAEIKTSFCLLRWSVSSTGKRNPGGWDFG
ncbi:hypothetical protein J6590_000002 [Homalodisca vitripennis]|nr:hypothetical protein J6590_000002 [Homalodisca vitripennis]